MIPRSPARWQTEDWQQQLATMIRSSEALFELLELDRSELPAALAAEGEFPVRVPRHYAERIEKGNPNDPLLLQVLPQGQELIEQTGFVADPLNEAAYNPLPGLIHKYQSRVLLVASPSCAINCRYCFRRSFPYSDNTPGQRNWQPVLDYIRQRPEINEVILSGGDPLVAPDSVLKELLDQLEEIPGLTRLRIHTRLPIVIPQRVTGALLEWLTGSRLKPVVVVHCNHPNELDEDVSQALSTLRAAGITLLNQSVILKGVNDSSDTMVELSEKLFAADTLPYYLHMLDPVSGAAHFELPDSAIKLLHRELLARLPGFLVPTLVREESGAASKIPQLPSH